MDKFADDLGERLRALDPAAGAEYRHPDGPAMLARITATPRQERVGFAPRFRLRMAGAAAGAAAVAVGGILGLQAAAPSLSVLALGAANTAGAHAPTADVMRVAADYTFVAGPGLSNQGGEAPIYDLSAPSDFSAASDQVAAAFDVSGTPSQTPGPDAYWSVGDESGNSLSFWSDASVVTWDFSDEALASPPVSPTTVSPGEANASDLMSDGTGLSEADADADANSLISALGVSADLSAPSYSTEDSGNGTTWAVVSYTVEVGGTDTNYGFDFTFDASGNVVFADGEILNITEGGIYPTLSPVAGVSVVQKDYGTFDRVGPILFSPTPSTTPAAGLTSLSNTPPSTTTTVVSGASGPSGTSGVSGVSGTSGVSGVSGLGSTGPSGTSGTSGSSGVSGASGTSGVTTTTTPSLPDITVTLVSDSVQYSTYTLADGTEVLLPQYVYTASDGSVWYALALDPTYVQLAPNQGGFPGGVEPLVAPRAN